MKRLVGRAGVEVKSIAGPEFESDEWKALGKYLDDIHGNLDEAIHKGFVHSDYDLLEKRLAKIEQSTKKARRILTPNRRLICGDFDCCCCH